MKFFSNAFLALTLGGFAMAQSTTPDTSTNATPLSSTSSQSTAMEQNGNGAPTDQLPTFKVNVVGRTTKAVNYHFRSGATKVNLTGTSIAPQAHGSAKVESHLGRISIELDVSGLPKPQSFGSEYLTYVAFAITPEGRAQNLGEIVLDGGKKITVTTDLQAFGIIVTAEPYFGVTRPSDVVVMENTVRPDTVGATEYINARFDLLGKGSYIPTRAAWEPQTIDPKVPLALHEARNAVRIAQIAGADKYATQSFDRAVQLLKQADEYQARKHPENNPINTVARQAVQQAEDSRVIALRHQGEERLTRERQASAARESAANEQATEESRRRAEAEQTAQEEQKRSAEAQAESETANRQRQEAEAASKQAAQAQAAAEQAQQAALQQQQQAQAETERARQAAQQSDQQRLQAEREREELRARLLQQFNLILETRDTARGLIVNMSDVLFDSGKWTLRPLAREKLAKLSGIVLAYPGLKLQVEGHTDSVGGEAFNQTLSEKRADGVRDYLTGQGIGSENVSARGFGKTQPIASNATARGRQQNRRVEIVVSGEVIGTQIGGVKNAAPANTPVNPQQMPAQPRPEDVPPPKG